MLVIIKEQETNMLTMEKLLYSLRDDITPKWVEGGAVTGTLNARDNNGPQCVVTFKKTSHPKAKDEGQGWAETEVNDTLNIFDNGETRTPTIVLENHPADSRVKICKDGIVQTLSSRMGTGGGNVPMVMENQEPMLLESTHSHSTVKEDGIATTLVKSMEQGMGYVPMVAQKSSVSIGNGQLHDAMSPSEEVSKTLNCMDDPAKIIESQYDNLVVRRLTPLECSRLQGYPDGWMDIGDWIDGKGKLHKDSDAPKYKAAGNSIALPFWQWLMDRISAQLKKDGIEEQTMASLFDGIGGFPLVSTRARVKPLWCSEIEEFPIAVTKKHFSEVKNER